MTKHSDVILFLPHCHVCQKGIVTTTRDPRLSTHETSLWIVLALLLPVHYIHLFAVAMSTRRKPEPTTTPLANGATVPSTTSTTTHNLPVRSPFFPTRLETLLIAIYPGTLLLGSLFSIVSSSTRNAPYSATLQAHPPEFAPSYFAQKKNVFNVYFVKVGWFWTTLAFFIFLLTNPSLGPPLRPVGTPKRLRAVLRYLSISTVWYATTQWFFGPPLIDRGFRLTGGACQIARGPQAMENLDKGAQIFTAAACKIAGGQWKGGHDISGHVFLLIMGSALLWSEILPAVTHSEGLRDGRTVKLGDGSVSTVADMQRGSGENQEKEAQQHVTKFGVKMVIGVAALMWWMLLMTAAFFHTWVEKFTGLLVAFTGLWIVYFLPRGVPALRAVLGMPGV